MVLFVVGCRAPQLQLVQPATVLPMREAVAFVNANIAAVGGTLRASGSVDGYFTQPEGGRRSYHLDGILFHLAPRCVRFDLKSFGDTQLLFGSNKDLYWVFNKQQDEYVCGRHGVPEDLPLDLPARPDQLVDALGLTLIPVDELGRSTAPRTRITQRVDHEAQQLLFLVHDEAGRVLIEKEFWIDRFPPYLIRKVVVRDGDGAVEMESTLSEYKMLGSEGPMLAHHMVADWPKLKAQMRYDIRTWSTAYQLGPDAIQFATPTACSDDRR